MAESKKVKVVFPNDDYHFEIDIEKLNTFNLDKEFGDCMFGWWEGTYIKVLKEKEIIDGEEVYVNPLEKTEE